MSNYLNVSNSTKSTCVIHNKFEFQTDLQSTSSARYVKANSICSSKLADSELTISIKILSNEFLQIFFEILSPLNTDKQNLIIEVADKLQQFIVRNIKSRSITIASKYYSLLFENV